MMVKSPNCKKYEGKKLTKLYKNERKIPPNYIKREDIKKPFILMIRHTMVLILGTKGYFVLPS